MYIAVELITGNEMHIIFNGKISNKSVYKIYFSYIYYNSKLKFLHDGYVHMLQSKWLQVIGLPYNIY